jgi:hypothetical protein
MALFRKVTAGDRPSIPDTTPQSYTKLIQRCWSANPDDRPPFTEIVRCLGEAQCLEYIDLAQFQEYQIRVSPTDLITPITAAAQSTIPATPQLSPLERLEKMADDGDPFGQVQFGQRLQSGDGITKDLKRAA